MNTPGIGIIGAGLIGHTRAEVIQKMRLGHLIAVYDTDQNRAEEYATQYGCTSLDSESLLAREDISLIIIAVPNVYAYPLVARALRAGKHVVCEKPLGIHSRESKELLQLAHTAGCVLLTGFNHRFHPAILRAKELTDQGTIGKLMTIRARYGHGGRLGMEKEWRFQKDISGGGELRDQGVHLIDLARWFAGEFDELFALCETKFWQSEVEDNAFVSMRNERVTMQFHVSVTNWKNIFSFEIFGTNGFCAVEGLGRSYGSETLTIGRRKPEFGVPDMETLVFEHDSSWEEEWKQILLACEGKPSLAATGYDGYVANVIVEAAYDSAQSRQLIPIII